jgi:hypothetical protein
MHQVAATACQFLSNIFADSKILGLASLSEEVRGH